MAFIKRVHASNISPRRKVSQRGAGGRMIEEALQAILIYEAEWVWEVLVRITIPIG